MQLSDKDRLLTEYVIGNIDDEGYLRRAHPKQWSTIFFTGRECRLPMKKFTGSYIRFSKLILAGVGAIDLQECLRLQLERKKQQRTN